MQTIEISRSEWQSVLDQFSRAHHGQPAIIRITGASHVSGFEARDLPLLGITFEQQTNGDGQIEIMAGDAEGRNLSHTIRRPTQVRMAEWNDAVSALLEIQSQDATVASVQVGPSEQLLGPEMITDGFYPRD